MAKIWSIYIVNSSVAVFHFILGMMIIKVYNMLSIVAQVSSNSFALSYLGYRPMETYSCLTIMLYIVEQYY